HESLKRQAVGAYDLVGAERLAGHDHLVARGENGYPRPAAHREPGVVHGSRQTKIAHRQMSSRWKTQVTLGEVQARRADVAASGHALTNLDPVALAIGAAGGIFLNDDRIAARGKRAAGEDAHRFPRAEGHLVRTACCCLAHYPQAA